jgi:hypothetical protein
MEATTTASAMRSIGHLRLEYRAGTEQSSREATQSFSAPGPACIAANRFHRSLLSSAADRTSDEPNAAFILVVGICGCGPAAPNRFSVKFGKAMRRSARRSSLGTAIKPGSDGSAHARLREL